MKKNLNPTALPPLILGLGGLGLSLRAWLYGTGLDASNLLIKGHPAGMLLWPVCLIALGLLAWQCRNFTGQAKHSVLFPKSLPAAIGCWAAAVGILITALGDLMEHRDLLHILCSIMGLVSFPALIYAGYCRMKDLRPSFLLHTAVCIFFALRLACMGRDWSSEPQIQDFLFQLLAHVSLMLSAFYRACFDQNIGKRPTFVFFNLLAVFSCCLAIPASGLSLLYLTTGFWIYTNLCTLSPLPKAQKAPPAGEEVPPQEEA